MSTASNKALSSQTWFAALAELVGTFFLTLAALTVAPPLTVYAVGLTLLVFVYAIGGISGAHLNPAVTVGLVASRRFPLVEGLLYVVAQVAGAWLARLVATAGFVGPLTGNYHAGSTGADATAKVVSLVEQLVAAATAPVLGIGVGSPGVVDLAGVVRSAPNLGWRGEPLQATLAERFDLQRLDA